MNRKQKILFIVNPISGGIKIDGFEKTVQKHLDLSKFEYQIYKTSGPHDATKKAEACAEKFDIIVAVGGDGTINEVAQALVGRKTALGIIPKGSGNGFANNFSIPHDPTKALKHINNANQLKIDTATFNSQFFLNVAGLGFDAHIANAFDTFGSRGFISYARLTLREFFKYVPKEYEITIDGEKLNKRAFLVTIANSTQFGNNAFISPLSKIDDGLLEVVILEPLNILQTILVGIHIFNKTIHRSKYCTTLSGKEIYIKAAEQIAQIDGEPTTSQLINHVNILPGSLNMIV